MPITFNEKKRVFKLDAGNSTYAFLIEPNGISPISATAEKSTPTRSNTCTGRWTAPFRPPRPELRPPNRAT